MLSALWAPLPRKRPRGGWRQRLDLDEDAEPQARISEHFGHLMLDWCDGDLSSSRLQAHSTSFLRDGFAHPMATRLADVGSGQNAQRGMMRLLESCGVPQLLTRYPGEMAADVVLPSAWVRLVRKVPHEFKLRLGAEGSKLKAFWTK